MPELRIADSFMLRCYLLFRFNNYEYIGQIMQLFMWIIFWESWAYVSASMKLLDVSTAVASVASPISRTKRLNKTVYRDGFHHSGYGAQIPSEKKCSK